MKSPTEKGGAYECVGTCGYESPTKETTNQLGHTCTENILHNNSSIQSLAAHTAKATTTELAYIVSTKLCRTAQTGWLYSTVQYSTVHVSTSKATLFVRNVTVT